MSHTLPCLLPQDDCTLALEECDIPTVADLLQSEQLPYVLDPLKMPLKLSFLDEAKPSKPKIWCPRTDETCASLRAAYRLEGVS